MADYTMLRAGVKSIPDFQRIEEEFQLKKQEALQKQTGQDPAALRLANEYEAAIQSGNVERANRLAAFAKIYDKNVMMTPDGQYVPLPGLPGALGELKYGEQSGAELAKNQYEPDRTAANEAAKLNQQYNYKPLIDAASKAEEEKAPAAQEFINNTYSSAKTKADQALDTIAGLRGADGKGLAKDVQAIVGFRGPLSGAIPFTEQPDMPGMPRVIAGTPAASGRAKVQQAKGQVFLEAYESLRGAGALTNIEGQKGEQAKARLDVAQSEEEFEIALGELEKVIKESLVRLENKKAESEGYLSGIRGNRADNPAGGHIEDGYEFLGGDPANPSNWRKLD